MAGTHPYESSTGAVASLYQHMQQNRSRIPGERWAVSAGPDAEQLRLNASPVMPSSSPKTLSLLKFNSTLATVMHLISTPKLLIISSLFHFIRGYCRV